MGDFELNQIKEPENMIRKVIPNLCNLSQHKAMVISNKKTSNPYFECFRLKCQISFVKNSNDKLTTST